MSYLLVSLDFPKTAAWSLDSDWDLFAAEFDEATSGALREL